MPMPTGGPWPPPAYHAAYQAYRDWDAWYGGNPDRLREVYRVEQQPPSARTKPSQYAGGVVGRFSRWLRGNPANMTWQDTRLHVPLPADLAATSANLLFAEPPQLSPGERPPAGAARRLEQLAEDGLAVLLLHAAEPASAFGDVYLRPVIDQEVLPDRAFLTAVHADSALPTIRWGRMVEVTFWSTVACEGQAHWRLLEHHHVVNGQGRITYALYEGGPAQLGRARALADRPELAHLVDVVDETSGQSTGLTELDVVRIPNSGPQRLWRCDPHLRYLGRSDFDGNEQMFDRIDEVWTSWMRDIRLGKGRITVPSAMLQDHGPGAGSSWDPDREIYSQINALPKDLTNGGITVSQFAIRHAEHKATIDSLVEAALRHAGLSAQTLGDQPDGSPVTATEVQQRERQSFQTRGNRIQSWQPRLARVVQLLLMVERAASLSTVEPFLPHIEFGDSVSEAPETLARTVEILRRAEAVSFETRVRMVHPDWDQPQVDEEVQRLMRESGQAVEDPGTFRGSAGDPAGPPGLPGGPAEE